MLQKRDRLGVYNSLTYPAVLLRCHMPNYIWNFKSLVALALALPLEACGLRVPEIGEPYESEATKVNKMNLIKSQVKCELKRAVQEVIWEDRDQAEQNHRSRGLTWLEAWSAKASLTLTAKETTALNPGLSFITPLHNGITNFAGEYVPGVTPLPSIVSTMTPSYLPSPQSYTMGIGGTASSEADLEHKSEFFYSFSQALTAKEFDEFSALRAKNEDTSCHHRSDILIESDLKIKEWLQGEMLPYMLGNITRPETGDDSVAPISTASTHITFTVITSGNATPAWKLVRVASNQGSLPFLKVDRTRIYDLLITIGQSQLETLPKIKTASGRIIRPVVNSPSKEMSDAHLAVQIGSEVANALLRAQ
jgi:hypothetical protein